MEGIAVVCEYFLQNDIKAGQSSGAENGTNIFMLEKKYASIQDVRTRDVVKAFPLSKFDKEHEYVFRFEQVLHLSQKQRVTVWMDVGKNLDVCVPNVDGQVRMKVLKMPKGVKSKTVLPAQRPAPRQQQKQPQHDTESKSNLKKSQPTSFQNPYDQQTQSQTAFKSNTSGAGSSNNYSSFPDQQPVQASNAGGDEMDDFFKGVFEQVGPVNKEPQNPYASQAKAERTASADDWTKDTGKQEASQPPATTGWDDDPWAGGDKFFADSEEVKQEAPKQESNLFDFDDSSAQPSSQVFDDQPAFGLVSGLSDLNFGPAAQTTEPEAAKPEQEEEKQSATERVREIQNQQLEDQRARDEAAQKFQQRLEQWVGKPQKNHVRVLLCTLQDILWPNCGWERVSMDKVHEAKDILKVHRQYIRKFHPDRIYQTEDPEKIYIANYVFTAITEAYRAHQEEKGR